MKNRRCDKKTGENFHAHVYPLSTNSSTGIVCKFCVFADSQIYAKLELVDLSNRREVRFSVESFYRLFGSGFLVTLEKRCHV